MSAFAWWEKQRIIFNAIVGTAGISGLIIASPKLALIDIVGILVYGIIANLFMVLASSLKSEQNTTLNQIKIFEI